MNPELEHYLRYLDDLRGQVRELIAATPVEGLNWRPVEGVDDHAMNSLAVMATHAAGAEHFWIAEVVGRRPATRHRPAEFTVEVESAGPLLARLDELAAESHSVFQELTEADLAGSRQAPDRVVTVRWAIMHAVEHTALHLGHMQITYQLFNAGKSHPAPRWFERVPRQD
jgi:hypothetical protein